MKSNLPDLKRLLTLAIGLSLDIWVFAEVTQQICPNKIQS